MENLKISEMENISALGGSEVVDGICAAVGLTRLFGWAVPGLNVAVYACTAYAVGRVTGLIGDNW